ncbi:hypothetical protein VPH49_09735 [Pseudomonas luteola]|uniref:hypothetical protein n=1 Tax=Pseudomonas luteola TaxID=47886 RepID=UPI003A88B2F4
MSEFKLVPVEPNLEMISAMIEADWKRPQSMLRGSSNYLASMYQAAASSVPGVEDKRVTELEAELADLKVSYQTLKWESEDNFKRSAQYANEAEVRKAELAEAVELLRRLIPAMTATDRLYNPVIKQTRDFLARHGGQS